MVVGCRMVVVCKPMVDCRVIVMGSKAVHSEVAQLLIGLEALPM